MKHFLLTLVLCTACVAQVSPFGGLGVAQFFDNNGNPLTAGVLYSYQAGTTSQQATWTDATGTVINPNPIAFTTGARASIWLASGQFYKFVLCAQNDGSFCAPADVLFTVDQVPGSPSSGSGGGGGGSGPPFISGSANPATSGILRLASGDTICWRNAANSANLCVSKDSSDVLTWPSSMKFQEIACSNSGVGFDYLCADSTAHRFKVAGNGGSQAVLAYQGTDINAFDQVAQLHFGTQATPLGGTALLNTQYLQWNGTNIIGTGAATEVTFSYPQQITSPGSVNVCGGSSTAGPICSVVIFLNAHILFRLTFQTVTQIPGGCSTNLIVGVRDITASTTLASSTITNGQSLGFVDSGALSVAIPAGHQIGIGAIQANAGCTTAPIVQNLNMVYQ